MMWTSEEILQATIDVFMDEYGATLVDLGPTGMDIDLSISAAVVAYEAGADPDHVEAAFGVSGWIIKALANETRNRPPEPLKRTLQLVEMVSDRVESRSRGA